MLDKNNSVRDRRIFLKNRAKNILSSRGNLLRLIGAVFIVLTVTEALIYLCVTFCHFFFDQVPVALFAAFAFLLLLAVLPFTLAVSRMAFRMSVSEKTEMKDVLYYFNLSRLRDAYLISFITLGEAFFMFALSFVFGRLIAYAFEGIYADFFSPLALVTSLIIMPFLSGVFTNMFTLPCAYFMSGNSDTAMALSKGTQKGQVAEITVFNLSFIPLLVISAFTLGILFFVYLLPVYMISSHLLASFFIENKYSEINRK